MEIIKKGRICLGEGGQIYIKDFEIGGVNSTSELNKAIHMAIDAVIEREDLRGILHEMAEKSTETKKRR